MDNKAIFAEIANDIGQYGTLKESILAHAGDYGINTIEELFPDPQALTNTPIYIKRRTEWVDYFTTNVSKKPFSRLKNIFADITGEEARALGYIKGNKKKDEVFDLLKRVTLPTTIYKKQAIDNDDKIDIKDFDVVAWLREEMKQMLDEELARACLVSDGRDPFHQDKINENNIRPIFFDDDLYTIKHTMQRSDYINENDLAFDFIDKVLELQKDYKGSGNLSLFINRSMLVNCMLVKDKINRRIYSSVSELGGAMNVVTIVPTEIFNFKINRDGTEVTPLAILVDLNDYVIGFDNGGKVSTFSDFDIDYNKHKYLIETRCSGTLIRPYSAIAIGLTD